MNKIEKEIIVIYHANCLDGMGAAYASWLYFGDKADYIPMQHGQPIDFDYTDKEIYILDFSFKKEIIQDIKDKSKLLMIIDHHVSAQTELSGFPYNTIFDMSKSGCVLAWKHFHGKKAIPSLLLYIQDNDLWQFKYIETKKIVAGLNYYLKSEWIGQKYNKDIFKVLECLTEAFDMKYHCEKDSILKIGEILLEVTQYDIKSFLKKTHTVSIANQLGLACNADGKYSSDLGHELAKESGAFGCVYWFNGQDWIYSLRSVGEYDVSKIAVKLGGGGHKNAASFKTQELLFKPQLIGTMSWD